MRRNSSAPRNRSRFRSGSVGGLDENVDDLLLAAARRAQDIAELSAGLLATVVVRDPGCPNMFYAVFSQKKCACTAPCGRPYLRHVRRMRMMQDHRRREVPCQFSHPLAPHIPVAPRFHIGPSPRAEHGQIVAPQNQHALGSAMKQVRLQVGFLHKRPFLPRHRVGFAGPPHRLAPFDIDDGHELRVRAA